MSERVATLAVGFGCEEREMVREYGIGGGSCELEGLLGEDDRW